MAANDYEFVTRWRVFGTAAEIYDVLSQIEEYPRWWPAVYLAAQALGPKNDDGAGKRIALLTKGWLPYTLSWELLVTEARRPETFAFDAEGDFVGGGRWELEASGAWVDTTLTWRVRVEKPLIARLSPVLKPIFAANHRWAMRRGEESLMLELARRRAASPADRDRVPAPPRATTSSPVPILVAGGAVLLLLGAGLRATHRRRRRACGFRRVR